MEIKGGQLFLGDKVRLFEGDSRDVLKTIPSNSIDSVVTDPPYALVSIVKRFGGENAAPTKDGDVYSRASAGFMGKQWDTGETAFAVEFWAEVMRVLKPGGHVVAASGTRTYHRLAVAIEDAGFEIRDMISWLYGSGFPKSHDVSKGIYKAAGAVREVTSVVTDRRDDGTVYGVGHSGKLTSNAPATPEAAQWQGWGTALKPACEPWVLARKPFRGTVAGNVLDHGTGAINVDGCRVGSEIPAAAKGEAKSNGKYGDRVWDVPERTGRFPANVIHDGSDEVVSGFPAESGGARVNKAGSKSGGIWSASTGEPAGPQYADSGSAARFFYSAKADKMDRAGSKHPTVKPVDLMQYLCRLITPPGGTILDPFAGSGSTGEAAWREGFQCVLIERESEYAEDIRDRLRVADKGTVARKVAIANKLPPTPIGGLFGDEENVAADRQR